MEDLPHPRDWIDFTYSDRDTCEEGDPSNRDMLVPCPKCARPIIVEEVRLRNPSRVESYLTEQLGCQCDIEDYESLERLRVYIHLHIVHRIDGYYPSVLTVDNWWPLVPDKVREEQAV